MNSAEIDLTENGHLSIDDSILIDKISKDFYASFNSFVRLIVSKNKLKGLDLISSTLSRNPFHSSLVNSLLKLFLLKEKLEMGHNISNIIIDNNKLLKPLKTILKNYNCEAKIISKRSYPFFQESYAILRNLLNSIGYLALTYQLRNIKIDFPDREYTILDTFIFKNSFSDKGDFTDRYFTGFSDYLDYAYSSKVIYAPILSGVKKYSDVKKIIHLSSKSKHKFIFQESILKFSDHISSLLRTLSFRKKIQYLPLFCNADVREIFFSESKKDIFHPSMMVTFSRYFFSKRLSKMNFRVNHVVDWNENQNIDKAFILGVKKFLKVKVFGYQGFFSPAYEMHKVPEAFEYQHGLLPDHLFSISESNQSKIKDRCPQLSVSLANALRFSKLKDLKMRKTRDIILVALPMNLKESDKIIQICKKFEYLHDFNDKILIKVHPANDIQYFLKKYFPKSRKKIELTSDPINLLYPKAKIIITSASSVAVESIYLRIPVAIYGNRYGITMNPIEDIRSDVKKTIFYDFDSLLNFINAKQIKTRQETDIFFWDNGESIRKMFLENRM